MATKGKDAQSVPADPQAQSESTAALLRELVAHLRQNRTQLREEWARRITRAQLLTAMTEEEIFAEATSVYEDRKSTRLNSSHLVISYAVFCLKKKKLTKRNLKRSWDNLAPIGRVRRYGRGGITVSPGVAASIALDVVERRVTDFGEGARSVL